MSSAIRAVAVTEAKLRLGAMNTETVKKAVEAFRNSMKLVIANAQAQEAERLAPIEARIAKRAAASRRTH